LILFSSDFASICVVPYKMKLFLCIAGNYDEFNLDEGMPPLKKRNKNSSLSLASRMLQNRYLENLENNEEGWSENYTELALVKDDEKVAKGTIKEIEEFTKLTLQGHVDKLLQRKVQLMDLRDIFHYQEKPCPRLILIMGCPG